jgi:hypothetical protein
MTGWKAGFYLQTMCLNTTLNNNQLTAKGLDDLFYGLKLGRSVCGQRLVKVLAAQVGLPCYLAHALGLGDIAD